MFNRTVKTLAAFLLYSAFAIYLYQPHFEKFDRLQYALLISVTLGAIGCYILSRRWTASFPGSFFAGALYGFGPFMLGLAKFHPTASVLAACIPWLFLPAAYGAKGKWRPFRIPLSILPFIAIIAFFMAASHFRLFPASINVKINSIDLISLLSPQVAAKRGLTLIGFYHIPIVSLIIGFAMLIKARRLGILIIIAAGTTSGFFNSFLSVSPIIWFTIPLACCAVIAGAGIDGLILAGWADRKWILASAVTMLVLAVVALLLASKYFQTFAGLGSDYAKLFLQSAKIYLFGAVTIGIVFFITKLQLRLVIIRTLLLCCALGLDIFLGAQYVVDKVT